MSKAVSINVKLRYNQLTTLHLLKWLGACDIASPRYVFYSTYSFKRWYSEDHIWDVIFNNKMIAIDSFPEKQTIIFHPRLSFNSTFLRDWRILSHTGILNIIENCPNHESRTTAVMCCCVMDWIHVPFWTYIYIAIVEITFIERKYLFFR